MEIINIPTEQTTAATDALVAIMAAAFAVLLSREGARSDRMKGRIWSAAFGLLAVAAALGAIAHGFQMSARTNELLWMPLNLVLGVTVALFVAGAVYDLRAFSLPRLLVPILLAVGVAFFFVTVLIPGSFLVFVIYEAIAMLFSLVVYIVLAARQTLRGAATMAAGVLISIVAAAVQATGVVRFTLIWEFDHNGAFHLIQMVGLVLLLIGLRTDLVSRRGA
jgi:hypothetical protein